ncbi:MAG: hypothetical protein J6C92_14750 [Bacteroidaceae bacterium]|nr:hypothetical protein [Bacteroidaceae bacterium]
MRVSVLIDSCAVENSTEVDMYDEVHQINETTTFGNLWKDKTEYPWLDAEVVYWNPSFYHGVLQIAATLRESDI